MWDKQTSGGLMVSVVVWALQRNRNDRMNLYIFKRGFIRVAYRFGPGSLMMAVSQQKGQE